MNRTETVAFAAGGDGELLCICGNTPMNAGFYSSDEHGNEVSPGRDWKGLYTCDRCGRIIKVSTLEVVAQKGERLFSERCPLPL